MRTRRHAAVEATEERLERLRRATASAARRGAPGTTLVSAEYAGRGAGSASSAAVCGTTAPGSPPRSRTRWRTSNHEAASGSREVVGAEPPREHQRQQALGEVAHERGRPDAVSQTARVLAHSEPPSGTGEVVVAAAEHVAHPHDERRSARSSGRTARPRAWPGRRRTAAPVRRSRRRAHPSRRRTRSRWRCGAAPRRMVRAASARCCGPMALSRNAREGSASLASTFVNAARFTIASGRQRVDRLVHGIVIADVERRAVERVHLVVRGHLREERSAQAATRARDDQPHAPAPARIARTQSGWPRYHSTVRASPSSNGTTGRQPSSCRRSLAMP